MGGLVFTPVFAGAAVRGVVQDASGAKVAHAEVQIRNAAGAILLVVWTNEEGRFDWPGGGAGYYQLRISAQGLSPSLRVVLMGPRSEPCVITLEPESVYTRVTVSATRGGAEEAMSSPHVAFIQDLADILKRPVATLGNVLEREPGVLVQQSTYAQASPFLRGLTGYHVLNLVDGIRFNNSAFRSGPNQYLAFLEPTQALRVEALLGPTGSQYGSDSLGGTIHVVTEEPRFGGAPGWETHGEFALGGGSADLSGIGRARVSLAKPSVFWLAGVSGRRHHDLRAGQGHDSRNVFHRLFGMSRDEVRDLLGSRLQDTGFRQYGVQTKVAARLRPDQTLTLHAQRGGQDQVRGYKDLLGGLGRMQSAFDPQILNWFSGRYEHAGLGLLDSLSGTFSINSQADGGLRQDLRHTDPVTRDFSRVNAYGYTAQATAAWAGRLLTCFGGDIYDERITSRRSVTNPATGTVTRPRPLYPSGSRYQNFGFFGQGSYELSSALRASAGARVTGVRFQTREDARLGVPDSSQWFRDVTFHTSLRWQWTRALGWHGIVSRGFRAPNLNDLGALGLNDLGYEIPAAEAIPAGALLGTDAGEGALSKGQRVPPLAAESLMNYEFGARVTVRRLYARVQFFNAEFYDPIVRRTLLFPASDAPERLAGLPVTVLPQTGAQREQGVVSVATQLDPRAVKAFVNDGRARYYGLETVARHTIAGRWSIEANYGYILGRELNPNRNIRRLPPQMGAATLRHTPSGRSPWVEVSLGAAGAQERLSGGDNDDERIGASRRRRDIADFFRGSRVAPCLDPATGVFRPTGETLAQIQNRVLPLGALINGVRVVDDNTRVPLYRSTPGWVTLHLRSGIPLGERWQALAAVENLLDRNYRTHGSGIDAPGVHLYLSLIWRF